MEQSKREFTEEIANLFKDYEESYVPGEWETFQAYKKQKRYPFSPQWIRIAAVLALLVSVLPFVLRENNRKNETVVTVPLRKKTVPEHDVDKGALKSASSNPLSKKEVAKRKSAKKSADVAPVKFAEVNSLAQNNNVIAQVNEVNQIQKNFTPLINEPVYQERLIDTLKNKEKKIALGTAEFLLAESKKNTPFEKKREQGSKWDFGVEIMPTATSSAMNVNAGLVTSYRISEKLSLSSGISIVQLGAGDNIKPSNPSISSIDVLSSPVYGGANGAKLANTEQRVRVDAQLSAIDIPLGIVYKLNKNYYTSAGVSYFNVLKEKRSDTYLTTQSVNRTATNQATGEVSFYNALETSRSSTNSSEQPLDGNSYIGFFNFSFGRRQQVFKNYNFQIEPFVKVPIGRLSNQEVNLMNTGVKFQFSF